MNILLLGSGGREHTLAWKMAQSPLCDQLYIAPGNAGTAYLGTNLKLDILDFVQVASAIETYQIDMLVVGPEEPLVRGIADHFKNRKDIMVIGPDAQGALLEGSKAFAKEFMAAAGIPTARYQSFTRDTIEDAFQFLTTLNAPYVLKADGLAAGKGVIITPTLEEAKSELTEMLDGRFGDAGTTVVIEEFLTGIEYSVFALTDGKNWKLLPVAKDYKRVGEGDTGPNTGGMGAVSPVPFFTPELKQKTIDRIIQPTMKELQNRSIEYKGFIFFGLINVNGDPFVIEYNCRMGDPETEVVIPRLTSDLVELFVHVHHGTLDRAEVQEDPRAACTIVLCSGGYPGSYSKGLPMQMPDFTRESLLFHAGTRKEGDQLLTNGGRVMAVTSLGDDLTSALSDSLQIADEVNFEGKYYRKDIGFDLYK
jgi:phosphoribosylamine---glycine ligase